MLIDLILGFPSSLRSFAIPDDKSLDNNDVNLIQTSDIAGTDLYAESIDVYLAGNSAIIKQSMFSNDTSILPQFDMRDPAFDKCNILISASNGILPEPFPKIMEENGYKSQYEMSYNSFAGFLYYDPTLSEDSVSKKANRALEIIERKFEIDLILLNVSESNFFPFVGYYPNWELYLQEVTGNLPMDGYWKVFDRERLSSSQYLNNHHLSSTCFILNDLDIMDDDFLESIDQVNFNLDALNLAFLENINIGDVFEQFSEIIGDYSSLFGNFSDIIQSNDTISQVDMEGLSQVFNSLVLSNESHYVSLMIQYEGLDNGITSVSGTRKKFDLWKSLNYNGEAIRPSEKVFIALIGAFMSNIDIKIFSTEIIDVTPSYFKLYDFLLEQIGLILFYAGVEFDVESLKNYSFKLIWMDEGGFKRSYVIPVNLEDPTDYVNFLHLLGLQGFAGIPTGLFNSIENLVITYEISKSEPNLLITKELINQNSSFGVYQDFSFNVTAKNEGNETVWGIPTSIPINIDNAFSLIVGPIGTLLGLDEDLKDAIWEVVRIEYPNQYSDIEPFFNFDKDPRLFYFDTSGAGLIDTYYPDVLNFTNLLPYNEKMEDVIQIIEVGDPQLISALNTVGVSPEDLINTFTNSYSIWNEDNWKLEPNESISYIFSNFSISDLDSFTPFYRYNFTIQEDYPELPSLVSGVSINDTTPYMALSNDSIAWQIASEEKYVNQYDLEIQFLFENNTGLDLTENSLDRVSIILDFKDPENVLNIQIFNFSTEEFNDISDYLISVNNDTHTFAFIKNQGSLDWMFNPETQNNHTIIVRLIASNSESFNISLNDFDIEFSYRDTNEYKVQPSRVLYSSASGYIEFVRYSNTISLSTYDMASIVSYSEVLNLNSASGEINEFSLIIENIGTRTASNINVSIQMPGIILDKQNFTLSNNTLLYHYNELAPSEKLYVKFSFYVPNSIRISKVNITYHTQDYIKNIDSNTLESNPNDIYITAPIDYESSFPFVKVIDIYFNSSNPTPLIGESFNISIGIKNRSPIGIKISNISISMNDYYGALERIDNNSLIIDSLESNGVDYLNISVLKNGWKGYYYPPINYVKSFESNLIQIGHSDFLILGVVNFSISKSVDKNQVEIGGVIRVKLTVFNTGTICTGKVDLSDIISFNQLEFNLVSGSLINNLDCLSPGQNISYFYEIEAVNRDLITLRPASIEYYYLQRQVVYSNNIIIKVMLPQNVRILFILIPGLISILTLFIYIWQSHKYKAKKYETQRYESSLLKASSTDSILKIKATLRERLTALEMEEKKKNKGEG